MNARKRLGFFGLHIRFDPHTSLTAPLLWEQGTLLCSFLNESMTRSFSFLDLRTGLLEIKILPLRFAFQNTSVSFLFFSWFGFNSILSLTTSFSFLEAIQNSDLSWGWALANAAESLKHADHVPTFRGWWRPKMHAVSRASSGYLLSQDGVTH